MAGGYCFGQCKSRVRSWGSPGWSRVETKVFGRKVIKQLESQGIALCSPTLRKEILLERMGCEYPIYNSNKKLDINLKIYKTHLKK